MTVSVNYPTPVMVNGFSCKNCTEVDEAKKHIDPAHPKDGPYGIYAKQQASSGRGPAVTLGGTLASLAPPVSSSPATAPAGAAGVAGQQLNTLV